MYVQLVEGGVSSIKIDCQDILGHFLSQRTSNYFISSCIHQLLGSAWEEFCFTSFALNSLNFASSRLQLLEALVLNCIHCEHSFKNHKDLKNHIGKTSKSLLSIRKEHRTSVSEGPHLILTPLKLSSREEEENIWQDEKNWIN